MKFQVGPRVMDVLDLAYNLLNRRLLNQGYTAAVSTQKHIFTNTPPFLCSCQVFHQASCSVQFIIVACP